MRADGYLHIILIKMDFKFLWQYIQYENKKDKGKCA